MNREERHPLPAAMRERVLDELERIEREHDVVVLYAQTEPGSLVGTPFYLAPEQLEGFEPDERADLYAAGVVLYEIFTGALPFSTQGNLFEVISRKLQEPPTPPRDHWPTMPEALADILMRCLTRDREKRFQAITTLLDRLEVLRA